MAVSCYDTHKSMPKPETASREIFYLNLGHYEKKNRFRPLRFNLSGGSKMTARSTRTHQNRKPPSVVNQKFATYSAAVMCFICTTVNQDI